ncbi:hypothetical protein N480_12705 [Pseudoalteromonas luteoviolacea S2607]|nr:hypothetical protein N480_12705 [Pseudoalteromonas luteoviolacea S2607]
METKEIRYIIEHTFKHAYNLGKEDSLNGIHISIDTIFNHYLESPAADELLNIQPRRLAEA